MSKKPNDLLAKEFNGRHKNMRLEIIMRECQNCLTKKPYIYMGKGDIGHIYQCLSCQDYINSRKKLK